MVGELGIEGRTGAVHGRQVYGKGATFCGQLFQIPLQPENTAVLMEQGIVATFRNAAAACGDYKTGFFAEFFENLRFIIPENLFTILRENTGSLRA